MNTLYPIYHLSYCNNQHVVFVTFFVHQIFKQLVNISNPTSSLRFVKFLSKHYTTGHKRALTFDHPRQRCVLPFGKNNIYITSSKRTMAMLSPKAKTGFLCTLQLGCFVKFIPYKWNSNSKLLNPPSPFHVKIFNFHKNLMYSYTLFMVLRLIQASKSSGHFPLQQKILSASWTNAFVITSVGFFQLELRQMEIMHYANRLLALIQGKPKFGKG